MCGFVGTLVRAGIVVIAVAVVAFAFLPLPMHCPSEGATPRIATVTSHVPVFDTTVSTCTEAALSAAVSAGGTVVFGRDCPDLAMTSAITMDPR